MRVALRKESVDRNSGVLGWSPVGQTSLSARRAWIEMANDLPITTPTTSLSARRAWIEMHGLPKEHLKQFVALRKESVDRNNVVVQSFHPHKSSLSARRAWIEIC